MLMFDYRPFKFIASSFVLSLCTSSHVAASPYDHGNITAEDLATEKVYSPYVGRAYPDQVLFGDSHFHTNLSFDAGLIGTSLTAHEGYRFARGEKVISNTGQPVQLVRPLDFLVITDHAEFIGLAPMIQTSDPLLLSDSWGKRIYDLFNSGQEGRMQAFAEIILSLIHISEPTRLKTRSRMPSSA